MSNREKKEFLCGYLEAKAEVSRLEEELAYWHSKSERTTRAIETAPDGDGRASLQAAVAEMDALGAELGAALSRQVEKKKEVERAILGLRRYRMKRIIAYKYLDDLTWEEVAEHMELSVRQIYRLHEQAVSEMSLNVTLES